VLDGDENDWHLFTPEQEGVEWVPLPQVESRSHFT
jgi:hypothetical protein